MLTLRLKEWARDVIIPYLEPRLEGMHPKPRHAFEELLQAL